MACNALILITAGQNSISPKTLNQMHNTEELLAES